MYDLKLNINNFLEQSKTDNLNRKYLIGQYKGLKVDVSFGRGSAARVPWMVFLADGQKVYRGIFPAIYIYKKEKLIALCYGVSSTSEPSLNWKITGLKMTIAEYFEQIGEKCNVFQNSYIYKIYKFKEFESEKFINQLEKLLDIYVSQIKGNITIE